MYNYSLYIFAQNNGNDNKFFQFNAKLGFDESKQNILVYMMLMVVKRPFDAYNTILSV
jgi:hypothetical protein